MTNSVSVDFGQRTGGLAEIAGSFGNSQPGVRQLFSKGLAVYELHGEIGRTAGNGSMSIDADYVWMMNLSQG